MNDDWRLEVDFDDSSHIGSLVERLDTRELEHELSDAFDDRVIVSPRRTTRSFSTLAPESRPKAARELVLGAGAQKHGWKLDVDFKRLAPDRGGMGGPGQAAPGRTMPPRGRSMRS